MKNSLVLVITLCLIFAYTSLHADAIGGKIFWNQMLDDYSDAEYDDGMSLAIFYDAGRKLFNANFRPGIEYHEMQHEITQAEFEIYAFHIDWYWFLGGDRSFKPFVGFGPALNYYQLDDDQTDDNDSDAGIEGFGGLEFNIASAWNLRPEARFVLHDIADTDKRVFKVGAGLVYYY